eukprot:scaffold126824_cov18-Prasinocladus_malaysianus.AAC.1
MQSGCTRLFSGQFVSLRSHQLRPSAAGYMRTTSSFSLLHTGKLVAKDWSFNLKHSLAVNILPD